MSPCTLMAPPGSSHAGKPRIPPFHAAPEIRAAADHPGGRLKSRRRRTPHTHPRRIFMRMNYGKMSLRRDKARYRKTAGSNHGQGGLPPMGTPARPDTALPNTAPSLRFLDCVTIGPIRWFHCCNNGSKWLRFFHSRPDRNSFLPCRNHPEYLLWGNFRPVQHPGSRVMPGQHRKPITIGGAGR